MTDHCGRVLCNSDEETVAEFADGLGLSVECWKACDKCEGYFWDEGK